MEGLWIGGSSALARTYWNTVQDDTKWTVLGLEITPPAWLPSHVVYRSCDLTTPDTLESILPYLRKERFNRIILSVRPPLVTSRNNIQAWNYASQLLDGIRTLLQATVQPNVTTVLHISSIAAVGHLRNQHNQSETSVDDPTSAELPDPYDRFKRACEEAILSFGCYFTNLRLGAIFSDDDSCIQCAALQLQAFTRGPLLATCIDCNSSANVCRIMKQVFQVTTILKLRPVYYYTRPVMLQQPVPYGYYLQAYREAYGYRQVSWIPLGVVYVFCWLFHAVNRMCGQYIPYWQSIDYLLQVTMFEHSFDMTALQQDFDLTGEESILDCFQRRKKTMESLAR